MSTSPTTQSHHTTTPASAAPKEVIIYGHTALFYWWPVWFLGFIFAVTSYYGGARIAIVPPESTYYEKSTLTKHDKSTVEGEHNVIALPRVPGKDAVIDLRDKAGQLMKDGDTFDGHGERVHPSKNLGVIYVIVLFTVIMITNVPMRGLSSAIVVSLILLITVFFAYMDWWEHIFHALSSLTLHMNTGFYLFFSCILFVAWAAVTFGYDRMSYWRITKDQITHEYVIGGGQKSYNTESMAFEKLRDDMFRHWVLGGGSGDLIMYPLQAAGATREEFQIHNVWFVGKKLAMIQELIATKGS
jgi:hypothetical protein